MKRQQAQRLSAESDATGSGTEKMLVQQEIARVDILMRALVKVYVGDQILHFQFPKPGLPIGKLHSILSIRFVSVNTVHAIERRGTIPQAQVRRRKLPEARSTTVRLTYVRLNSLGCGWKAQGCLSSA